MSARVGWLGLLDSAAHIAYCPTMLGRRSARARWYHRLHLIPGRWLTAACDAYDRALGVTEDEMYRTASAALACPDGCTRIGVSGGFLTGGTGACGQRLRPAPPTTSSGAS